MTTPNPTPAKQNSPASPDSEERQDDEADENTSSPTGFFNRVWQPEPVHPSEAAEIVVMDEGEDGHSEKCDDAPAQAES